jgi:hypothetical protein
MYFLYLDDSGSVANKDEKFFVLGGAVIPEEKHFWVNKNIDDLAQKLSQDDPFSIEFHACDIFSARKYPWKEIQCKQQRIQTIQSVLDVANRERLTTIACAVDKKYFSQDDVVSIAFEDVISRFQSVLNWLHRETNQRTSGMIVIDKSAYEHDLQKLALKFRGSGTRYRQISGIQEVPLFVDSRASRAVQLADHIAYAVFRRYNAEDLTYFNRIQTLFGPHGLSHVTKEHHLCTCPACIRPRTPRQPTEVELPL